jgi:predicted AlkP superfamily pyrophosphatase or phosphodiesterase
MRRCWMKSVLLYGLILVLCPSIAAPEVRDAQSPKSIRHVFIISIDGLLPASYTQADSHGLRVPTLRKLMQEGSYSNGVETVFPSASYPAHTTIATGCLPATHGIVANLAWDPLERNKQGWRWYKEDIRVPTLWEVVHDQGLATALVGWPVTVGADADILLPDLWRANTSEDLKLLRASSTRGLLDTVARGFAGFYNRFPEPDTRDEALTDIAVHAIRTIKPNLLMLQLIRVNYEQHVHGIHSAPTNLAIEDSDQQVKRVIEAAKAAGIWEHTAVVVLSDHGFAPVSANVRPGILLLKEGLIELDEANHIQSWKAVAVPSDGTTYIYVKDAEDRTTRQKLLDTFPPLAGKPGSGISRVVNHEQIIARGGDPLAYLAIEAADGFEFEPGYTGEYIVQADSAATHGYFPDRPEMQGSLLVYGPLIGKHIVENARLIDIGPTVANWLGVKLERSEGSVLPISSHNLEHSLRSGSIEGHNRAQIGR